MSQLINDILSLGYAVPGLILAVGITRMFTSLDSLLINFDTFITGSILGLVLAYIIKTYAISNNVLNSAYASIPLSVDESAKTLGTGRLSILKSVHIPMLKTGLFTSFLLVMAELIKELPATLILRPFNFDTLATQTYEFAIEEMIPLSSIYSSVIIIICCILLIFLKMFLDKSNVFRN